jgi:hypothetical protein
VAIDLHDKLRACRRAGVREHLIWRALKGQFDWFVLEHAGANSEETCT